MLAFILTVCLLAGSLSPGESFSLPLQCTGVSCPEGTICVVNDQLQGICTPISTKAGSCPLSRKNPECLRLRGAPRCLLDDECPGTTKCCTGCCEEPPSLNPDRETTDDKAGECPPSIQYAAVYWWTDLFCPQTGYIEDCQLDVQCPNEDKCCPGLCGKECSSPYIEAVTTTTTTTTLSPVSTDTVEQDGAANETVAETNVTVADTNATLADTNGTVAESNGTVAESITVDEVDNAPTDANVTRTTNSTSQSVERRNGTDAVDSQSHKEHKYPGNATETLLESNFLNETVNFEAETDEYAGPKNTANATMEGDFPNETFETTTLNATDAEGA